MNASARSTFIFLACTILGAAKSAPADTLYLKNGMYIVVTRAAEKDGQIDYWVGSTKYTISKEPGCENRIRQRSFSECPLRDVNHPGRARNPRPHSPRT